MRAADLMTREVVSVNPDMTVEELCDLFRKDKITGAPVVDAEGRLLGIVSKDDVIFRRRGKGRKKPTADIKSLFSSGFVGFAQEDPGQLRVSDIMTRDVLSATEEASVDDLCRLMWEKRVHRLPIVRGTTLVGIVSALDICKGVANGAVPFPRK
ncbi:MAG: CBS domain-containing protein [Acidobacteriota bacterium]